MLGLVDYSDASSEEEIDESLSEEQPEIVIPAKKLVLPPVKTVVHISDDEEDEDSEVTTEALIHAKLPKAHKVVTSIEEKDDEFLKKKAVPSERPPKPLKGPVRITIPSLSDFKDEDMDIKKVSNSGPSNNKGSGLLGMLPQPKTERNFTTDASKNTQASSSGTTTVKKVTSLVPDSVKKRQELLKKGLLPGKKAVPVPVESDDDDDENDAMDFFSLDKEEKLPDISSNEIALMVAKKAAKMAEAKSKVDDVIFGQPEQTPEEPQEMPAPVYNSMSEAAVHQLIGGNKAKRAKIQEELNIIDITDADIMPDREEFRRQTLTRQTQFVPTGRLEGYDKTGKRNSQITKLAQRAQANEQELEAMWASNRQNKRAASSKYGF